MIGRPKLNPKNSSFPNSTTHHPHTFLFPEPPPSPYVSLPKKWPLSHQTLILSSPIDLSPLPSFPPTDHRKMAISGGHQYISPRRPSITAPFSINFTSFPIYIDPKKA
ncbi:hypothetical protein AABB24_005435 [Solanum stoloniferum]|uniref:Uncharacterized protein n=1 Tax=Solanum stoloniferum TaxID=62892 RepID=A0ABD2UX78_9SOLN